MCVNRTKSRVVVIGGRAVQDSSGELDREEVRTLVSMVRPEPFSDAELSAAMADLDVDGNGARDPLPAPPPRRKAAFRVALLTGGVPVSGTVSYEEFKTHFDKNIGAGGGAPSTG
jgi:hypothetical protein